MEEGKFLWIENQERHGLLKDGHLRNRPPGGCRVTVIGEMSLARYYQPAGCAFHIRFWSNGYYPNL